MITIAPTLSPTLIFFQSLESDNLRHDLYAFCQNKKSKKTYQQNRSLTKGSCKLFITLLQFFFHTAFLQSRISTHLSSKRLLSMGYLLGAIRQEEEQKVVKKPSHSSFHTLPCKHEEDTIFRYLVKHRKKRRGRRIVPHLS